MLECVGRKKLIIKQLNKKYGKFLLKMQFRNLLNCPGASYIQPYLG